MSLIAKIILFDLAFVDLQKFPKYFNGTAIAPFFKILLTLSASLFPNNLA